MEEIVKTVGRGRPKGKGREMTWTTTHTKIMILVSRNTPTVDIAKEVGTSPAVISKIRTSNKFLDKLTAYNNRILEKLADKESTRATTDKAREILLNHSISAARKLIYMARTKNLDPKHRLKFDVCRDILDRAGLKAVDVVETRERASSPEELESMKKTLLELDLITQRLSNQSSQFLITRTGELSTSSNTDKLSDNSTDIEST